MTDHPEVLVLRERLAELELHRDRVRVKLNESRLAWQAMVNEYFAIQEKKPGGYSFKQRVGTIARTLRASVRPFALAVLVIGGFVAVLVGMVECEFSNRAKVNAAMFGRVVSASTVSVGASCRIALEGSERDGCTATVHCDGASLYSGTGTCRRTGGGLDYWDHGDQTAFVLSQRFEDAALRTPGNAVRIDLGPS